jgi:F-type H+-transporting ATPase subunit gamma
MPSLKEIKGRISSVKNTLKITSAMKLVASSKLRKAQSAIESMLPYEEHLHGILNHLMADFAAKVAAGRERQDNLTGTVYTDARSEINSVAIVAFASNSSLCGGFNANVIRLTLETIREYESKGIKVTVYSIGRKMAEAMRKAGYPSPTDYTTLSDRPAYDAAATLAGELMDSFANTRFDRIELIYNHFLSTSSQRPTRDTYLPLDLSTAQLSSTSHDAIGTLIVEPSTPYQIALLLPKVLKLNVYTVLLDSAASEHAARTVAMQTATDNGNELLQDLTLEYNKGRQQKITSEILDLVGGSLQ